MDKVYQAGAGGCGVEAFLLLTHIAAFVQSLYYGGTCGGTAYAVLLQCVTQVFITDQLAGGLHGPQQGGFGVGFGRLSPFLLYFGQVSAALIYREPGQDTFFVIGLFIGIFI